MTSLPATRAQLVELSLGLLTWGTITLIALHFWHQNDPNLPARIDFNPSTLVAVVALFITNFAGFCWRLMSRHRPQWGLVLQGASLLVLMSLFPSAMIMILGIMLVGHLGEYLRPAGCLMIALLLPLLYYVQASEPYAWINASMLGMFNLFALLISSRLVNERRAREASAHLLRELRATQTLLFATAQRDERLRIARDLHDVLGHHLTALSIQLEVANQLGSDPALPHIQKARDISRLLLSDVREAVSDIRQSNELDMAQALKALVQDLKHLQVTLNLEPGLNIHNARVAEALFRTAQEALTNSIRHGRASRCTLDLTRDDHDRIRLVMSDNGHARAPIVPGNGLTGMRERIEHLDGTLQLKAGAAGFTIDTTLPDPAP
ncbi:sensor histidine kinase [Marinobacter xestospongiae]|uniref:Histidine kinase n=1 Tax=Marinobacter xestospongiae TaxID=994319 RepID=A0ABU3VUN5_9GAMM|nr:histidine kinase [Marinobacter xestospongiae]MDV2077985.1 histidine kinase [Marinobacter xestospongiae]